MAMERTEMHDPAVKMAAAMMPSAEMVAVTTTAVTAAMMATTVMTTTTATTAVAASMSTFCDRKVGHTERRCEDNGCDSQRDLWHGTSHHRRLSHCRYAGNLSAHG